MVELACSHCGSGVTRSFSWFVIHFSTRCDGCRKVFMIDRAYLLSQIQQFRSAV